MSDAERPVFLGVVRELVHAYQAFHHYDARLLRDEGMTTSQADILFTLGNTDGMTFKKLGERTLITKGTLTGVVDRMSAKGLVTRRPSSDDGRSMIVVLTEEGRRLFDALFPRHLGKLKQRFEQLETRELESARVALQRLRRIFED